MARFPWRSYPRERLVLALVALAALAPMHPQNTQDASRLAVTQSLVSDGRVDVDRYRPWDHAARGGHWYSDKAPGLSFYAVPFVVGTAAVDRAAGNDHVRVWAGRWHRYALRLLIDGPLFVLLVFVLGRMAEGLVDGAGAATAVFAGLGTLLGPLAPTLFGHVGAALLAFGAFALAWRRSYLLAGLAGGAAVLWEYQTGIAVVAVLAYVAYHARSRGVLRFLAGAVPAAIVLAVYDAVAFGSPLHLSYSYVANSFAQEQQTGFFGIDVPSLQMLRSVVLGGSGWHVDRGLLVTSPVLIAAAFGLVVLWRRGLRAEAAVCLAVAGATLVYTSGYFLAYGGTSPGPRFFAPALPFLALGLAGALERARAATLVLGVVSVGVMTLNELAWALDDRLRLTILPETVWSALGAPKAAGVALVFATAAAALATALVPAAAVPEAAGARRT